MCFSGGVNKFALEHNLKNNKEFRVKLLNLTIVHGALYFDNASYILTA
jgi:hypothetical protein